MAKKTVKTTGEWTHPSVQKLAPDRDPVAAVTEIARALVLQAQERGWSGPPFDPTRLAEILRIQVVPRQDIPDARTVPVSGRERIRIEYNPDRPRGRVRYSIAHEIAHTFFPDCAENVRHRQARSELTGDEWQLEALCNIAASEILMPVGSFAALRRQELGIDQLMTLRKEFDVSAEALLLRCVRLTHRPCFMFAAANCDDLSAASPYRIDYSVASRVWTAESSWLGILPPCSVASECTAIGFTAKRDERWPGMKETLHVECVGIPPYPGRRFPRVVGIVTCGQGVAGDRPEIVYLKGNALSPRGDGPKVVAHVVNDRTPRWGGGFALEVRKRWKTVQDDFIAWTEADKCNLSLGNMHTCSADEGISVCSMIAQHGYGPSKTPRIRYRDLTKCLNQMAKYALEVGASIHMPRIGCGQAGGLWEIVGELIEETICSRGIRVTVYDLPSFERRVQRSLL